METQKYDIFSAIIKNPLASLDNIVAAGFTTDNSFLESKDTYKDNESVKEYFTDTSGNFDQVSFDNAYDKAQVVYNQLANSDYEESLAKQAIYHRENIFVNPMQRRQGPDYREMEVLNPYHISEGVYTLGRIGDRRHSVDELAQANKILLNPTSAGDNLEDAQWGDSPNNTFFSHFFDTLVLAQYDEDGFHIDPITQTEVEHKKGDLKLDDQGEFYYELLDGRNIYGRQVLNKMNIITTDGSWANQFDFFDSDDIAQKSIGGSILKNLALVGSMYIPYVGTAIAGISILTQLAGLGATFSKMISGSDNPTLSAIEGWAKSMDRRGAVTEYAQEHPWCWENMINLIGDVAAQLREQRIIFEKAPMLFKGFTNLMSQEGRAAKLAQLQARETKLAADRVATLKGITEGQKVEATMAYNLAAQRNAQASLDALVKSYQRIGEVAGKVYMTGITINDTYGEAKLAGASDMDATLLTLGYAAAEYALLSTGLGEHIMPELRANRQRSKAIAEALTNMRGESQSIRNQLSAISTKEGKKAYVQKLFDIGKNIARAEYANGTKTAKAILASGVGEGLEEVSEEILADFSKGCYDIVKWLQNDNSSSLNSFGYNPSTGKWDSQDVLTRYSMSLVGGFIGGSLNNIGTNYSTIRSYNNMTTRAAQQELLSMIRNGEVDQFIKDIQRFSLGNTKLSATQSNEIDGQLVYAQGTKEDNQDLAIKTALIQQVNMLQNILNANGANISDNSFLDKQTLGDLRFQALYNSTTAGYYLEEFNNLNTDIAKLTLEINSLLNSKADTNEDGIVSDRETRKASLSKEDNTLIKKKEEDLKEKQKQLQELLEGKRSYDFIATSLFEMIPAISGIFTTPIFTLYAENLYKKPYDQLSEVEKTTASDSYNNWKTMEGREKIQIAADIYRRFAEITSEMLQQQATNYQTDYLSVKEITDALRTMYSIQDPDNALYELPRVKNAFVQAFGFTTPNIDSSMARMEELIAKRQEGSMTADELTEFKSTFENLNSQLSDIIRANLPSYIQRYIDRGYANEQTKEQLNLLIKEQLGEIQRNLLEISQKQDEDPFNDYSNQLTNLVSMKNTFEQQQKEIENLRKTPIEENINQFAISIGSDSVNIQDIEQQLNTLLNNSLYISGTDISDFSIEENLLNNLNNAIQVTSVYLGAIRGARTDSLGFGDYYGYNATLNEIDEKQSKEIEGYQKHQKLAEIDSATADLFASEIESSLNKLQYYRQLHYYNQGQKLQRQQRVSTKKDLLIYKRLKSIVSVLDDDKLKNWNDFEKFKQAILQLNLHEQALKDNQLSLGENRDSFEQETIQLDNAIYDFFNANQDKLSDPNKLKEFINTWRFNLFNNATEILTEDLENLDDNSMVWYLASRAAVRASDFYNAYKEIIDPGAKRKIAPIATQELAVYNNYAAIVSGDTYTQFFNAYRQSVRENWKTMSVDERKKALSAIGSSEVLADDKFADYGLSIVNPVRYQNIILTEGIPGSGKSSAVFMQTAKLLQKYHPELLKRTAIVHGVSTNSANKLKSDISIGGTTYDRTKFMQSISPEWVNYTSDTGVIPSTNYEVTNEGEIKSKLGVIETSTPPSVIFLDEVSQFSAYDLDIIDKYAKKYGITVLAAGDFDQLTRIEKHPININGQELIWNNELSRTSFIRSPKLGVSMRTDNTVLTRDLAAIQAFMNSNSNELGLHYLEDASGIYGNKVITYSIDEQNKKQLELPFIQQSIDALISTLKEGQKIGYIYNDNNSIIYWLLQTDKYRDFIDFHQGGTSQGSEGQYYIVELDYEQGQDRKSYLRSLYTGLSRAQQGSLVITPWSAANITDLINIFSNRVSYRIDEGMSESTYTQYAQSRKDLLTRLVTDAKVIQYKPHTKNDNIPGKSIDPPSKKQLPVAIDPLVDNSSDNNPPVDNPTDTLTNLSLSYANDQAPLQDPNYLLKKDAEVQTQLDKNNEGQLPVNSTGSADNSGNVSINMLLHSFNTFETGVIGINQDGTPKQNGGDVFTKFRIDSMNGLIKLDRAYGKSIRQYTQYLEILGKLRSVMLNTKDKGELTQKAQKLLERYFGQFNDIYVTFALKSSPYMGESSRQNGREYVESQGTKFSKGISEKTIFNGSNDDRSDEVNSKSIVAIIGNSTGDKVELPLVTLSSPFTLAQIKDADNNPVFPVIYNRLKSLSQEGRSLHDISSIIVSEFENDSKNKELIDLFKLFNATDRGIEYVKDTQWTLAGSLSYLGPMFIQNRGIYQLSDGFNYDVDSNSEAEWLTIEYFKKNLALRVVSKVLISRNDGTGVQKGHPFVLISYDTDYDTDKAIVDRFEQERDNRTLAKKIQLAYVLPPKASIKEYLENIKKILNKEDEKESIGQLFTSYKLLQVLINNDDFKQHLKEKGGEGLVNEVYSAITEVDNASTLEDKRNVLFNTKDWSKYGFTKNIKLAGLFDAILFTAAYNRNTLTQFIGQDKNISVDQKGLNIIETTLNNAGIDGIRYNIKIPKNAESIGSFTVGTQEDGYKLHGVPFKIHGKIDSQTFKGNMGTLVSNFLTNRKPLQNSKGNNHYISNDQERYLKGNSNFNVSDTDSLQKIKDAIKLSLNKFNLDDNLLRYFDTQEVSQAIQSIAQGINRRKTQNLIAIPLGEQLYIQNRSQYFSGSISFNVSEEALKAGTPFEITVINPSDSQLAKYSAVWDNQKHILTITPPITVNTSSLSEDEFNSFKQNLFDSEAFQNSPLDMIPQLRDLLTLDISNLEGIKNIIAELSESTDLIAQLKNTVSDPSLLQIYSTLEDLIKRFDPNKESENVCPTSFKIKF